MKNFLLGLLKNLAHPGTIIGLVVSIAIPFLVYLAPNMGHGDIIKSLEYKLPLPLFLVQFAAALILFIILNKDFREWLKSILPAKNISILAIVSTLAITIFAGTQIEARHRVQSDESIFLSVAQNMYYNQDASTCNQGFYEDGKLNCVATSNSFKTKGLSFLYLMGMPIFGTNLRWVFTMELLMLPLAILLMFLAIVAWTRQPLLAYFAALLMALQPTVLFQFRAMSVEPLYIFLSALSLLIFKWAYDRNSVKHWALTALVLAFFAQTRQETVFCFAAFILYALPKILDKKSAKAPVFFTLLSLFSVPVLLTISAYQGFGFQGGEFEAHGHFLEDVAKNWEVMTKPLNAKGELSNPFLSYFNYLFALGGLYLIFRAFYDILKKKDDTRFFYLKVLAFVILYHIQTYVILENVSGEFSIEINQRYSLVMIPTMAFLAALPVAHLISLVAKNLSKQNIAKVSFPIAIVVALIFSGWTAHYKEDFNKNIMYNRNHLTIEEHEILGWLAEQPQKNRLFIYGRPWHFVGYGISSIHYNQASRKTDSELNELINKYQGEVYYIRGLDCWDSQTYHKKAVEHRIATTCDVFERDMDMDGVKNILITNNYWVQIAKFNGRKKYNATNILTIDSIEMEASRSDSAVIGQDSLRISFSQNEAGAATSSWTTLVVVNDNATLMASYQAGKSSIAVPASKLLPGYNQIRFIVNDNGRNKKLFDVSRSYFNPSEGIATLADFSIESHTQGWGKLHHNESIDGNKFTIDGVKYDNGLGTHAPSATTLNIEGKYKSFRATVGLDDESLCGEGVNIEIIGDGKVLVSTPFFKNSSTHLVTADVEGVQKLTLKSTPKGSMDCSHVDFVNAVLIP